jgi:hypothetical protein
MMSLLAYEQQNNAMLLALSDKSKTQFDSIRSMLFQKEASLLVPQSV